MVTRRSALAGLGTSFVGPSLLPARAGGQGAIISLSTVLYAGYRDMHPSLEEVMRRASKAGFRSIEASAWNMVADWPIKELAEKAKSAGISISSIHCTHHYDLDMRGLDFRGRPVGNRDKEEVFKEFHQQFYQELETAGLKEIIVVEHLPTAERQLDLALRRLSVLRALSRKHAVTVTTENMPGPKREEQLRVLRGLLQEEGLYYCHDINHAAMAGFDPLDFVEFLPKLRNVHVVGNHPLICFGDGVPPGLGTVPMERILRKMREAGYRGPFTVEIYGFERNLGAVLEICVKALARVEPSRSVKLSKEISGLDWRDVMAIYSRKYLEEKIL